MQIASMFASLGFKVDTSGLDKFKQSLASARHEFTNLNQGVKQSSKHLRSLKSALDSVDTALNKVRGAGANNRIIVSYRDMATAVEKVNKNLQNITTHQPNTTKAIGKINSSVHAGVRHWNDYANAVNRARDALRQVRSRIQDIRSNSNISINVRQSGSLNPSQQGTANQNSSTGGGTTIIPLGGRRMLAGLLGNSLPTAILGGGIASLGYIGSQVVKTGQEQTRMELALQMSSKDMNEFRDSLKYVKEEALRLGLTSQELGKAFAQVNMAAEGLSQDKKKEIFTGLNEYMATMQLDPEKQKGVYTAFYQMFSKGKISQEEINQLAERGFSQKVFRDAIKQAYGLKTSAEAVKMQEQGKITDVGKVWGIYAKNLQKMARESGAYDKMLKSSAYNMNRFKETLAQLSKELMDSGLDELLGSVFKGLTAITLALIPLAQNLKPVIGAVREIVTTFGDWYEKLNDVTGGNNILIGVLLLLLGRFRHIGRVGGIVVTMLQRGTRWSRIFSTVLTGTFGAALGKIIGKFTVWGLLIWGVSKALSFVYEQMERSKAGQWTFFDEVSHSIRMMILNLDLADAKFEHHKARVRAGILGFKDGVIDTVRNTGEKVFNIKKPPTPQGTPITPYKIPSMVNNAMNIGNPSGIPYRNTTTVPAVVNIGQVVVDKNGMAVASKATTTIPNMISQ